VFLGTNSNLLLYCETAEKAGMTIAGIVDSDYAGNTSYLHGLPVLGSELSDFLDVNKKNYLFFIATNWSPAEEHQRDFVKRLRLIDLVRQHNLQCANIIDPNAQVSRYATLGQGIYIGAVSNIEPDVVIEDFVQIYYGVGISHGSRIGTNSVIQRHAGLAAIIGSNCYVGMWSKLYKQDMLVVKDGAIINPGLYVARDVAAGEYIKMTKDAKRISSYPGLIM